jgi:hypothetical protein
MKTRTGKVAVVLAVWFALGAGGRAAFADEPIPSEKRIPKNVLAYVSLRNVTEFKAQWPKTLFGQLERDESLADFRAEVERQFADAAKTIEDQLGMTFSDLLAIPHGEIAAAVMLGQGGKYSAVAFLGFGDREEAVQKLLTKATEAFENDGAKRNEEEVEETKVVVFQKTNEEGDQKPQDAGAWFVKDSFLVVGTDLGALKNVLTRWDGKHERVLAENDVYRYIVDKCRDENADQLPLLTWFVDPVAMVQSAAANPQQGLGQMAMVIGMIPALGFDKFRGVGGTFDLGHGEFDTVSRTLVYLDRPAKGVINLVQFDAGAQAPPKWLSSDWAGYTSVNWNVAKAYSAAEGLIDMFQSPGATAQLLQKLADDEHSGGIHLKKDVLDQLTGTIHIAEDDGGGKEDAEGGFLVAAELKNVAAFRATLAKLAHIPGLKINEREFQGETLYEIAIGGGDDDEEGGDGGQPTRFGYAVAEKHLMVASDVRLLERVMRGIGDRETLADSAAFKRIARKFPDQTASISFSRQDTQFKRIYEALRTGQAEQAGALAGAAFVPFDFSKLPNFDVLKKYLPASGGFMENIERGLKITSFSLRNDAD